MAWAGYSKHSDSVSSPWNSDNYLGLLYGLAEIIYRRYQYGPLFNYYLEFGEHNVGSYSYFIDNIAAQNAWNSHFKFAFNSF